MLRFEDIWGTRTSHIGFICSPFTTSWGPLQNRISMYLQNQSQNEWENNLLMPNRVHSILLNRKMSSYSTSPHLWHFCVGVSYAFLPKDWKSKWHQEIFNAASLPFSSIGKLSGSQLLSLSYDAHLMRTLPLLDLCHLEKMSLYWKLP